MTTKKPKTAAQPAFVQPTAMVIPVEKLRLAPENARFGLEYDEAGLKALAASMADPTTRQLTPVNAYQDGDLFMVWDGGRRLAALQLLAGGEGKPLKDPTHLAAGIQAQVDTDRGAARLRSAATFVREDLHPAQEFLIYKDLMDEGLTIDQIAAACAVTKPRVRQLLRLTGIAPEIIDAFRQGKLALDAVEAFTITDDRGRQLETFNALAEADKLGAWTIKRELQQGSLGAEDMWAKYVGREAYVAAGGTFLTDLFSSSDNEQWTDGALVKKLAHEMIEADLERLRADGWVNISFSPYSDYYYDQRLSRVSPNTTEGEPQYSDGIKATGVAFLKQEHSGKLALRVFSRPTSARAAPDAPQKVNPSAFGWGHGGHYKMTHVATEAVRVGLMNNHAAAYDAVVAHIAWTALRRDRGQYYETAASTLRPETQHRIAAVQGSDAFFGSLKQWNEALPVGRVAFNVAVADLSAEEKAELLALCFAKSLDASEPRFDARRPQRWRDLGWMAKHSGVDIATAWSPDEEFIKGGSKDAIIRAFQEMGQYSVSDDKAPKKHLVEDLVKIAKPRGWTPKLLAELTDVEPEPDQDTAAEARKAARAEAAAALRGEPEEAADPEPDAPASVMSREAFEAQIVEAFRDQRVELDEEAMAEQARLCLNFNLKEDGLEYGAPLVGWTPADADAMADLWDPYDTAATRSSSIADDALAAIAEAEPEIVEQVLEDHADPDADAGEERVLGADD